MFQAISGSALALSLLLLVVPRQAEAATYVSDQTTKAGESISPQHYRVYIPDGVAKVRAVIIHQHGCGRGDWNTAWDVHWRALADKWDAALVAPFLEGDCGVWYRPSNGSWRALTDALKAIGDASQHSELPTLPLALWGHSGGGDWVAAMMKDHPDRIAAAVARSGGSDPGAAADGIPTLLVRGSDTDIGTDVRNWFNKARPRGALLSLARDLDQWHDCADLRVLAIPFLDAALTLRLPATGGAGLQSVAATAGWLGNANDFTIQAIGGFAGDKTKANWLPDEATAKRWSEFANPTSAHGTGWATDTTPPEAAPWAVTAVAASTEVTIGWRARADLQTGIKGFNIYRDGTKVGTLAGHTGTANMGGDFFQWGAFGDEADPGPSAPTTPAVWPFPATWKDAAVSPGAHKYTVATINGQGLEGPKSVQVPVFVGANEDATAPKVSITVPVKIDGSGSFATTAASVTVSGTASDDRGVQSVVWSNDRGGTGSAMGTTAWTIPSMALFPGVNTIVVTAYDEAGHATVATLVITTSATTQPMNAGGSAGTLPDAGAAGASGNAGQAGATASGGAGAGGLGGGAQGTDGSANPDANNDSSGCSCRVGAHKPIGAWILLSLLWLRRRRR